MNYYFHMFYFSYVSYRYRRYFSKPEYKFVLEINIKLDDFISGPIAIKGNGETTIITLVITTCYT